jgi:hypothetical protein
MTLKSLPMSSVDNEDKVGSSATMLDILAVSGKVVQTLRSVSKTWQLVDITEQLARVKTVSVGEPPYL